MDYLLFRKKNSVLKNLYSVRFQEYPSTYVLTLHIKTISSRLVLKFVEKMTKLFAASH